ncbi:MAG: hypothetical protein ABI191_02160 [Rhizomicrobium sp.]
MVANAGRVMAAEVHRHARLKAPPGTEVMLNPQNAVESLWAITETLFDHKPSHADVEAWRKDQKIGYKGM